MVVKTREFKALLALAGLITTIGLVTACGTAAAPGGAKSAPRPAKVALDVRVVHPKGSGPTHWTLHCEPASGSAPDPASACKALLGLKNPFAPVSKEKMCPMILAGSEEIVITGTWFGHKVDRVVVDGECDLPLFSSLHRVFY
jgi:hypothetical protein